MSGVLIHDGRVIGHRKWCTDAVDAGHAEGIIVTPFATPRIAEPRHPSASTLAGDMADVGGAFIFDAMTHARGLPTTNRFEFYDGWDLWPGGYTELDTPSSRAAHVERVLEVQDDLGAPLLAPTVTLTSPASPEAEKALRIARTARGLDSGAWQSLAGTRQFWASGAALDGYVGNLATLRAPAWVITVVNDVVLDSDPHVDDLDAFVGLCRTVRSLSRRARVIVCYSDYAGLLAVAAGADTVGTGWHRAQKTFDPRSSSFHIDSEAGIRRQAEYVTQGRLHAILRRDTADQIVSWDSAQARAIRGGPMPPSANVERMHHLQQLTSAVVDIDSYGSARARYNALHDRYEEAATTFDTLITKVPSVTPRDKQVWNTDQLAVLEAYGAGEGF